MSKTYRHEFDDEEDTYDENSLLKDGKSARVPVFLRDSADRVLVDGLGQPLPAAGRQSGYVFADANVRRRAEDRDYAKAELSARWRGGLQQGDHVKIGDRHLEVIGNNPNSGKLVLADTAQLDADEIKQAAYDAYKSDVTNAWRPLVMKSHPSR